MNTGVLSLSVVRLIISLSVCIRKRKTSPYQLALSVTVNVKTSCVFDYFTDLLIKFQNTLINNKAKTVINLISVIEWAAGEGDLSNCWSSTQKK